MHSSYKSDQTGIGQLERQVIDTMSRLGKIVIRGSDLEKELGYNKSSSNLLLSRLCRKGWLQRLKSGVYRIVPLGSDNAEPIPEDAWAIAMELFTPCYISGWTAAEHWNLTEQIFNSTVILTGRKLRKSMQSIAGLTYRTKFINADNIFGVKKLWSSNKLILIADIHRTIIDILDDPALGGGGRHTLDIVKEYIQHKDMDIKTLWQYAEKLDHSWIYKRFGLIIEHMMHLQTPWLKRLQSKTKKGIINFDPNGPDTGPIITNWGIRMNIPSGDIICF